MPVRVYVGRKRYALIDEQDAARVSQYDWRAFFSGTTWYARAVTDALGENWKHLHRYILDARPGERVDHESGNGLDCRRKNLRKATPQENSRNSHKTRAPTTSQFKGVHWLACAGRWQASIGLGDGIPKMIGQYDLEEDAARAYDKEALEHFGEFARTNAMMGLYEGQERVDERQAPIKGVPTIWQPDMVGIRLGLAGMTLTREEAEAQRWVRDYRRRNVRAKRAREREKKHALTA